MLEDVTGILKCKRRQFCLNSNVCFLFLIDDLMEHGKIATAPRAVVNSSRHSREILVMFFDTVIEHSIAFWFFLFSLFLFFFSFIYSRVKETKNQLETEIKDHQGSRNQLLTLNNEFEELKTKVGQAITLDNELQESETPCFQRS